MTISAHLSITPHKVLNLILESANLCIENAGIVRGRTIPCRAIQLHRLHVCSRVYGTRTRVLFVTA